ncbi:MFS transporter [Lapillicoccus jejuensis]|uniref:Putative MFS family arabinose efflux permease n=1 Tax=Lapillicoccus jejuensis TaxID=402171 RepID=A0A542E4I6_9MICO|nr:MFS transporter [Lapillicoccus jejuensis]TQJ10258.1 putative MFS family arabinose efflux permease [Lapillicoccus jejuensis]
MSVAAVDPGPVRSLVPARMDRLPWTRFHWSVVVGLGVSWILDGLEIQLVAANGYAADLGMSAAEVGLTGTIYLIGQVVGALTFGRLTDKLGRKKLFILTLAIYLIGSGIAGLSPNMWFLWVFRFVAGLGIGGEYTAINSAIDELIPSKYRGRVDIAVNGTYWGGALLGAIASSWLLNPDNVSESWGWRIGFFIGPVMGLVIIFLRRHIPESPRWLVTHGRSEEADRTVDEIERRVESEGATLTPVPKERAMLVKAHESVPFRQLLDVFLHKYPRRTFLGLTMMITQSFLYNAIFFTYALVLENFYGISKSGTSVYFYPFAVGNLLGPLLLGHLFDTIGRRRMIFATYSIAGAVLLVSAFLFHNGTLSATTHTVFWCVSFFFASAGASAAYLTVSEIFPLEVRGQAISYFFAIGQGAGALAPTIYGLLIGDGKDRTPLFWGYVLGSVIMVVGGVVAWFYGIDAEGKGLEDIADPLSKVDDDAATQAA